VKDVPALVPVLGLTFDTPTLLLFILGLLVLGYLIRLLELKFRRGLIEKSRRQILDEAEREAERIRKEADLSGKEMVLRQREAFEKESQGVRQELRNQEKRLLKREEGSDQKAEVLSRKETYIEETERRLAGRLEQLQKREEELKKLIEEEKQTLFNLSGLDREAAERLLLQRLEKELEQEEGALIARRVEEARRTADEQAREQVTLAIQRCAAEQSAESSIATVDIANDDMKGRIIGREGRNIRAFEKATGVDVIVDDTPGVVVVSGFDAVRREIARRALERLILDGRIHPARIEEVVQGARREVEDQVRDAGRKAVLELDLHGVHPRLIAALGKLRFRHSNGQNVLQHSMEVGHIAGLLAGELRLDAAVARRCGLLHDVGKAVEADMEGGHDAAGADFARRCDERKDVVNAIAAHHGAVPPESLYAIVTQSANEISRARPGGTRDAYEKYVRRLEKLEEIARSFEGVEQVYAIQAGREVRVIVNSARVDDRLAMKLCRDIAKAIEERMAYPGEIRVTLIRESRAVEYAK